MTSQDPIVALLEEIRALLVPVAAYYQPAYEAQLRARHAARLAEIREIAETEKQRRVIHLLDGTRSQKDVAVEAGIDTGYLSRFIARLREAGLLDEAHGTAKPKLIVDPKEVGSDDDGQRGRPAKRIRKAVDAAS